MNVSGATLNCNEDGIHQTKWWCIVGKYLLNQYSLHHCKCRRRWYQPFEACAHRRRCNYRCTKSEEGLEAQLILKSVERLPWNLLTMDWMRKTGLRIFWWARPRSTNRKKWNSEAANVTRSSLGDVKIVDGGTINGRRWRRRAWRQWIHWSARRDSRCQWSTSEANAALDDANATLNGGTVLFVDNGEIMSSVATLVKLS